MAIEHNTSTGFLLKKALLPAGRSLLLTSLAVVALVLILRYVVQFGNALATLATFAGAVVVYLALLRLAERSGAAGWSYLFGLRGEWRVRKALRALPDTMHVIYDLPKRTGGNIDFVVVSPHGAWALEVKNHLHGIGTRDTVATHLAQARGEALDIHERLRAHGLDLWVTPVLVESNKTRVPHMHREGVDVLGINSLHWYFTEHAPKYAKCTLTLTEIGSAASILLEHPTPAQ